MATARMTPSPNNENPIPARFKVLEQLAQGEGEVVLRARDTLLQREVLLKRPLPCGFGGSPDAAELERSLREARTLARLQHPGVVRLIDVIETRDGPMLVMEPVPGETLAERVLRDGRPSPEEVRRLGLSVCAALEVVHAAGIVHRGVSAANLVLREGGAPVLTGFNFAKFGPGGSGTVPGTTFMYKPVRGETAAPAVILPPHPAPEQILGQAADARSDVFGLGWVLYELLTGEPPYSQEIDVERWTSPKDPRKLAPQATRALADVVLKCLQTSPLKRFASAAAVRVALEQCAPAAAAGGGSAAPKTRRWKPIAIAAAGVGAGVIALVVITPMLWTRSGSSSGDSATRSADGATSGERGVAAAMSRPAYDPHYREQWAVVIGINDYQHWPKLDYAVADAKSVKDLLVAKFGFKLDHVFELVDEAATRANIQRMLGGVLKEKTQRNDGVFVFFAGHGTTLKLPEGGDMGFLVPVDGTAPENEGEYLATLLPMQQIRQVSDMIPPKHVFFAVDACYGGLAAATERGMEPSARPYAAQLASLRSRQILTAGGKGETVIEKADWGHSAFTKIFLEGLDSGVADSDQDGVITSGEIANYIKTRVSKISDYHQNPQFKNLSDDEGEFLFLSTR